MSVDLSIPERAASLHADALVCDLTMPWVDHGHAELRNQTLPRMAQSGANFGVRLIAEMNRIGMIIDVSHTGYRISMEAMEFSQKPVVFSHSNPKSLWEHDRSISDDQAKACAATGGLVGVVGVGILMGDNDASTDLFTRQIDYYADLIGPEYIGLGLDYVYDIEAQQAYMASIKSPPRGNYERMTAFFQPEQLPELTELLLKKGYAETAIRGILGENFLRVARAVWR